MNSELILYQTEDGQTKIQTRLEDETVWLTQAQLMELFGKAKSTISEHLKNIFEEGELNEHSVVRNFRITATDGKDYQTNHYNLDVIISVGYRVKSLQGTKFRQWATARLREYLVKGFTMNDELLKQAGGGDYFEELLARIRDIRSSEKVFWRKVLDVYATSIDYDPHTETSQTFFKTIQNKMHWAAHGQTAAEIVYSRIDAAKPFLGLTNFIGVQPTQQEIAVAKNYLNEQELNLLNRIVTAYLEVAELQALNRKPMHMQDWLQRVDDFLQMTGNDILTHAGTVSHQQALNKAKEEYSNYKESLQNELSKVEQDFVQHLEQTTKQLKRENNGY
ncbi:cell filamentation protein Fic [Pedobacter sp. LMG 31464]|uniref:Cell filamentation protein Fic n=1 Tax=Pedobacter planticolens TaxID=2679964 RepID=A0A923IVH5_9SPHI|nr:RhuM family protein [Pedobacter planticolens]MBB2145169.1 cell filamentation protein Fic [Pedobacter planticolens]